MRQYTRRSHLSFAIVPAAVLISTGNHCRFETASQPPHASGMIWSICQPGHEPDADPVTGHGCCFLKLEITSARLMIFPAALRRGSPQYRVSSSGLALAVMADNKINKAIRISTTHLITLADNLINIRESIIKTAVLLCG